MSFDLILRGGRVVRESGAVVADVGIQGGRIAEVGDLAHATATEVVDVGGKLILPGLIDTQVHFREPGLEHKEDIESGTRAALMGGVTTVFEMPNTQPPTTTEAALRDKLDRARGRAWCHIAFFVGASPENLADLARLEMLPGTPGVKIFVGSSTGSLLVDRQEDLLEVLRHGFRPCSIHSEEEARIRARRSEILVPGVTVDQHPIWRDAEAARMSTERVIQACRETGRPVHILHISTAEELPLIAAAKAEGLPVTCEITPQHLFFDSTEYARLGTQIQQNPPIRSPEHRQALWRAFEDGLFDVFGSDHAPHTQEEKAKPYPESPSGMPGVQTTLPLLSTWAASGMMSWEKVVRMACQRPAELFGLKGKGRIEPGADADLVVFDPAAQWQIKADDLESKCGWTPYEGVPVTGQVEHVLLQGAWAVRDRVRTSGPMGTIPEFNWK